MTRPSSILIYGTTWCPDCTRALRFFDQRDIAYTWIDVDQDGEALKVVKDINHGHRIVPTIVFPDGDILIEPSNQELKTKFNHLSRETP